MNKKNFIDFKKEIEEYKQFAFSKNFLEVALAVVFTTITQKLINNISECIIMPLINFIVQKTEGDWRNLIFSPAQGLEIEIGKFISSFVEFIITSLILYFVFTKLLKRIQPKTKQHQST